MEPKAPVEAASSSPAAVRMEPPQLAEGRRYDKAAKQDWKHTTAGEAKLTDLPRLQVGIPDVEAVLWADDGTVVDSYICVELKTFNWDLATSPRAITKRVRAVARQIHRYAAEYVERLGVAVQPGVEFSRRPSDPACLALIEQIMDEECIGVVWMDETIADRKDRTVSVIWDTLTDSQLRRKVRQYARAIRAASSEETVYLARELLTSPRRQAIQDLFEAEGLTVAFGGVPVWALPPPKTQNEPASMNQAPAGESGTGAGLL